MYSFGVKLKARSESNAAILTGTLSASSVLSDATGMGTFLCMKKIAGYKKLKEEARKNILRSEAKKEAEEFVRKNILPAYDFVVYFGLQEPERLFLCVWELQYPGDCLGINRKEYEILWYTVETDKRRAQIIFCNIQSFNQEPWMETDLPKEKIFEDMRTALSEPGEQVLNLEKILFETGELKMYPESFFDRTLSDREFSIFQEAFKEEIGAESLFVKSIDYDKKEICFAI